MSVKKQAAIIKSFTRLTNFCKKIDPQESVSALKVRLKSAEDLFIEFKDVQDKVEEICGAATIDDQDDIRKQVEDYYFFCVAELNEDIKKREMATLAQRDQEMRANSGQQNKTEIKLPRISPPEFHGIYKEWPAFKDMYLSLIHNNASLTNVQKFHYLKDNVHGEAAKLIGSLHMTEANYPEAWKRITDRYEHKRFIVDSHLSSLFSLSVVHREDSASIKNLIDNASEIVRSLQVIGRPVNQWDDILVHVIASKLDRETHKQWELTLKKDELPTFDGLTEFLEARWQSLEMIANSKSQSSSNSQHYNPFRHENRNQTAHSNSFKNTNEFKAHRSLATTTSSETPSNLLCFYCNKPKHSISSCYEFKSLNLADKINFLKSKRSCFNCLSPGHPAQSCLSLQCNRKHHTSIHADNSQSMSSNGNNNSIRNAEIIVEPEIRSRTSTNNPSKKKGILLATAIVRVLTSSGTYIPVKALIDLGSENSLIQEKLLKSLGVRAKTQLSPIIGVGEVVAQNQTSFTTIQIRSCVEPTFKMEIEVYSMKTVTGNLPSAPIHRKNWPHLQGLKLADNDYDKSSTIQLLLGAEVFEEIILDGLIEKANESPTAINSRLGWLLFGKVSTALESEKNVSSCNRANIRSFHASVREESDNVETLDQAIRAFWELEEIPSIRKLSIKEQQAEDIFTSSLSRNEQGRYVVSLPFDPSKSNEILGESRTVALNCLYRLEKRFQGKPILKERYVKYIRDLIKSDHIELVPNNRLEIEDHHKFYMPHHPVMKEQSLTTKLRVVFNASRKSSSGVSLNDKLLIGPRTQEDLFNILIRWRKHLVAFIADIEKMYRQVKIIEEHRDYQRILWRFKEREPIAEYRISTVIDGTASAQFLATRALQQLAMDTSKAYEEASKIIMKDFYVDDLSSGSHSIEKAKQIQNDLIQVMKQGGFILRKWFSNCKELMENIPEENRHEENALVELIEKGIKTLGIYWNQREDCFVFNVMKIEQSSKITKKEVLSNIAKLFDPIGWLSPTTILAKIFFQGLWEIKKLKWEDHIPEDKCREWQAYRNQLSMVETIKIPRWIGSKLDCDVQLHGFSDASNVAYAAVVYSRVKSLAGEITISLISAKTKVAPLKTITTPKLELCGGLLLSSLMVKIRDAFEFRDAKVHLYSDSTTSLAWIVSHPNHWNIFVANRITEIQQKTELSSWKYINTENNPADCASRGVEPSKLQNHHLWWKGPEWLSKNEEHWPEQPTGIYSTDLEKKKYIRSLHVQQNKDSYMYSVLQRHSKLFFLLRSTVFMLRWKPIRSVIAKNTTPNAREIRYALNAWTKLTQYDSFGDEIECCRVNDEMPRKSKIARLRPFIDEEGILRVGGRLSKSNLPSNLKHPIILPKRHHLTKLIIEQAHQSTLHGGYSLMSSYLNKYWIFAKSQEIKRVISHCLTCFPYRCKPQEQVMADLPKNRVVPHRAFLHSGVDLAGPISIKSFIGRSRGKYTHTEAKSYVCLFVCLSTKAIHIELVSDQSAPTFILAFQRFVSRNGKCSDMYSDCGGNFVGANRVMREHLMKLKSDPKLQNYLAEDGTMWHFNPPAASHHGGLWESGVKSIKYHLKRLLGDRMFTFEELTTLLCQIEACLNSRPLCPINDDVNDFCYLTPGHFTIGEAPITVPGPNLLDEKVNRLSRYQMIQRTYQQFWKYWANDYLSKLQQRPKWLHQKDNIRVGQLVLYREDGLPPTKWPIARVIEIHPGSDDNVRVITLKIVKRPISDPVEFHVFKRPITKVSVLPIVDNERLSCDI